MGKASAEFPFLPTPHLHIINLHFTKIYQTARKQNFPGEIYVYDYGRFPAFDGEWTPFPGCPAFQFADLRANGAAVAVQSDASPFCGHGYRKNMIKGGVQ
jgi:hypothetical protein